ncbi:MAG: putative cupredoxin-like copper-binding protein [Oleiphilaceae bacterium]|jgi:uncharacterized cupredoxin-like copper-binding protein
MIKAFSFILLVLISSIVNAGLTAEDVLGEYWKDPLFGEAAESLTIQVEILSGRIWPGKIKVPQNQTIRFVFLNKSKESHLFAFTNNIDALMAKESFQKFIKDEIFHSKQASQADPRSHSHTSNSVDEAEAIVKRLDQRPTVFVKPNDVKEILVRFKVSGMVELRCVIDEHKENILKGVVEVFVND